MPPQLFIETLSGRNKNEYKMLNSWPRLFVPV